MTHDEIITSWHKQLESGSQKQLADALDISPQYLSDIMAGRRGIGPKLLKKLGLEKVVTYRLITQGNGHGKQ